MIAAVVITKRRWSGEPELVDEVALWGFPAGLIGGRLYHLLTSWDEVPHTWWGPFAVWKGGLGIWGGIALGVAVGLWRVKRSGASVPEFMDAGAPALLVAQSIGRIGNWFNQELFGKPTNLPWGLEIDPEHRPERYLDAATFHPVFLYEIIWNLSLAALLVWLGHHRRIRPPGLFALYVAGYSAFRIFAELIRVDPAHHVLGLRLNLFVAVVADRGRAGLVRADPASVRLRRLLLGDSGQRRVLGIEVGRNAERLVLELRLAVLGGRRLLRDVRVLGRDRGLAHSVCLPGLASRRTASGASSTATSSRSNWTARMKVVFAFAPTATASTA